MQKFLNLVKEICQPNPKTVVDQIELDSRLKKNRVIFWCVLTMTVLQPITIINSTLPLSTNLIIMLLNVICLVAFVVLCRSYIWIFDIIWTVVVAFCPVVVMNCDEQSAFIYSAMAVIMPGFIMIATSNMVLTGVTGIIQLITVRTTYLRIIKHLMVNMDFEEFLAKFVETNSVVIVLMTIVFAVTFSTLDRRTKEVAKAKKETEEALEHQKTFVFSFSHELRNPLNSLQGNLQLALMNPLASDTKEIIKTAKVCGELLLQLINNVLDTGKSDLGKLEISPGPTKVHDLFQRVWAISTELISRKNLKSHLKIEKKIPPILLLDGHRVNQVLMNLIGNAIKFTEKGGINISVKWLPEETTVTEKSFEPKPYDTESEGVFEKEDSLYLLSMSDSAMSMSQRSLGTKDRALGSEEHLILTKQNKGFNLEGMSAPRQQLNGVLKIIIKDSGCGMDEAGIEKLFQKFSQVSKETSKRQIGTGLGLYITKEICKNMQGDVRAYSKPGVGSTFIVCIPTSSVLSQEHAHLVRSPVTMFNILNQRNLKAIVADDSPFNVNMICGFLKQLGSKVIGTASNGSDAFLKYKESLEMGVSVDIVTLDIDMPKMDGKAACQKIRQFERQNNLKPSKIIFISGNYNEQQVDKYLDLHGEKRGDCFLKKPLLFEDFSSTIYRLTSNTE